MSVLELRQWCLVMALQYSPRNASAVDIAVMAEVFYLFVAKPTVH